MSPSPALRWAPAALVLVVFAVGWPSLEASFQFDDWAVIVDDARVHSLAAWWQSMPGMRPLLKASYAINWSLGQQPAGFRFFNLCLHACNAVLLALLLRRRARALALPEAAAWLAALLFALHPVQTESVTYVSGRSGALAACGMLVSLLAWGRGGWRWRSVSLLAFCVALGCKETALATPLLAWLLESTAPPGQQRTPPRAWLAWLAWLLPLAAMLAVVLSLPAYQRLLATSFESRSAWQILLAQAGGVTYLAGQVLRVWHQDIDPRFPAVTVASWPSVLLLVAWLAAACMAWFGRRRSPALAFAVLWFMACLVPTHTLVPRPDVANDRHLYLALAGPSWLLATWIVRRPRAWARGLAATLALGLAVATLVRNRAYATEVTFWRAALATSPANARAANNLGMALALACDDEGARAQFERAVQLAPDDPRPRINLRLLAAGQPLPAAPMGAAVCNHAPTRSHGP